MKQNRFFSAVYIIGTGLAISMVMTMAVVWHIRMSDVAPEGNRSRSYFTSNVTYKSKEQGYSSMSMLGYRLVRELLPELKVPERCCVSVPPNSMGYLLGGVFLQTPGGEETLETELRPCDAAFWQVFRLRFMAGAPFTEEEVASGVKRIVLAESLGDACSLDVAQAVHGKLCALIEDHKANHEEEPLAISGETVRQTLTKPLTVAFLDVAVHDKLLGRSEIRTALRKNCLRYTRCRRRGLHRSFRRPKGWFGEIREEKRRSPVFTGLLL